MLNVKAFGGLLLLFLIMAALLFIPAWTLDYWQAWAFLTVYFAWSLADNYEWHYGYKALFGLAHMDPKTYDRVFKPSARAFSEIIRTHRTVGSVTTIQPQASFW